MKIILWILIFLQLFLFSCSSTYKICDGELTHDELNKRINSEQGKIVLMDGKSYDGTHIVVSDELVSWQDLDTDSTMGLSYPEVYKIRTKQHARGAGERVLSLGLRQEHHSED